MYNDEFYYLADMLIYAGQIINAKGWVPATSGNFSARLTDGTIAITVSGKHKGHLQHQDIMLIDSEAHSLDGKTPSAETLLHTAIYQRFPEARCVLHPHSLNSVLISRFFKKKVVLEDYELLKAFHGIKTHESRLVIPIFPNTQNIAELANQIETYIDKHGDIVAYIIAGHGLYTWGRGIDEALRYLEAIDFLLACQLQLIQLKGIK